MKPFRTKDGRVLVDQLCRCGHRFNRHGDRIAELPGQSVPIAHHGSCLEGDCPCQRFTFSGYVFQDQQPEEPREP